MCPTGVSVLDLRWPASSFTAVTVKRRESDLVEQSYSPALGRPKQEDSKFEVNLDFEVKPSQENHTECVCVRC